MQHKTYYVILFAFPCHIRNPIYCYIIIEKEVIIGTQSFVQKTLNILMIDLIVNYFLHFRINILPFGNNKYFEYKSSSPC